MTNMKLFKSKNRQSTGDRILHLMFHMIMIFLAFICIYPFLVIIGSSFASQESLVNNGYVLIPDPVSTEAYKSVFANPKQLVDAYGVTIFVTVMQTLGGLALTSTFAYVLCRKDYPYRKFLSMYIFFTMLFNGGLVPTYILISNWLGLQDSIWALIIPGMCSAWNVMLMKGYFQAIPTALIESAKIDGAGEFRIFTQIIIPLSKPAFATLGLLMVLGSWNAWYSSLLYITSENKVMLQYLLMKIMKNIDFLQSAEGQQLTGLVSTQIDIPSQALRMAMCVLTTGPILVVFPFFQKYFTKGLTVGSVKG